MRILFLLALIAFTLTTLAGCGSSGTTASDSSGALNVDGTSTVAANGTGTISVDYISATLQQAGKIVTITVDNPVIVFETTTATLGSSGKSTFTFQALEVTKDTIVHVTITVESLVVSRTITVKGSGTAGGLVTPGTVTSVVNSIAFTSAEPNNISLKGVGGAGRSETSIITFVVKDQLGNPMANKTVDFALDTSVGGIALSIPYAVSDTNGIVQTIVSSGNTATTVKVTATVHDTAIATKSESLVISTGIPHQDGMSVSLTTYLPEALEYDNVAVPVQIMLADHFGNPVPDGTAVYFSAYGGSVEPAAFTTNGIASVNWRSQNPRPADGKARLFVYALGEESFVDGNGSGLGDFGEFTDTGEAFHDLNGNVTRDTGEPFIDFNGDVAFNAGDGKFNGVLQGPAYKGASTSKHIFVNKFIIMSGSTAVITAPILTVISRATTGSAAITDIEVNITDVNLNPMPENTAVAVKVTSANVCYTITGSGDLKVTQRGNTKFRFSVENSCTTAGSAAFTVSVVTPKGIKTEQSFTLTY